MTHTWHFQHPSTDWPCVATFDGNLLTVEPVDDDDEEDDDGQEWLDATYDDLSAAGLSRTCCASVDAAYRELRAIGAEVVAV